MISRLLLLALTVLTISGCAGERSFWTEAALYVPNRALDFGDIARAGVDVGPGFGVDVRATKFGKAALMSRLSAGIGPQSFRHLPVHVGVENYIAAGPVELSPSAGIDWPHETFDLRVELHALLIGAHAAINLGGIVDFLLGFIGLDPSDDDL